jgi:L-lactate dehydrogenase (cytochrome)
MAGGERGVQRAADILAREVTRTLQLLGVPSVAELTPDRVRLRDGQVALPPVPARP